MGMNEDDLMPGDETYDNDAIKQVREWGKRRDEEAKAAQRELKEAQERLERASKVALESITKEAGLPSKVSELYFKVNDSADPTEVTVDQLKEFATEYGITPQSSENPAPTETEEESPVANQELTDEQKEALAAQQQAQLDAIGGFKPTTGETISPQEPVDTDELFKRAKMGDLKFVERAVREEQASPGRIKYKHGDILDLMAQEPESPE